MRERCTLRQSAPSASAARGGLSEEEAAAMFHAPLLECSLQAFDLALVCALLALPYGLERAALLGQAVLRARTAHRKEASNGPSSERG